MKPLKGSWQQVTLLKNVAAIFFQCTDSGQKLTENERHFVIATIHFNLDKVTFITLIFLTETS